MVKNKPSSFETRTGDLPKTRDNALDCLVFFAPWHYPMG